MMTWHPAYVGLGSNLDDPRTRVQGAIERLASLPLTRLLRRSALYGSTPLYAGSQLAVQPDYVNAVAGLLTGLDVDPFFAELRSLEHQLGREPPRQRWGPRHIDLDLLVFGQASRNTESLVLPHPGIAARNWVLVPLDEVAPDLEVPGLGRVAELASRASREGLWRLSA
jgi:2-amino-4-hydroxy-6-hydroxymethyldihydropteridine diphosphokinase